MLVHRRDLVAGQPARRRRAENRSQAGRGPRRRKASEDAVPCADGPASSGSSFQCSRNKLGQQQRQRIWPGTGRVHYMHRDPVHLDTHLSELVETGL